MEDGINFNPLDNNRESSAVPQNGNINRNRNDLNLSTGESSSTGDFNPLSANAFNYQMGVNNLAPSLLHNNLLPAPGVINNLWTVNGNNQVSVESQHAINNTTISHAGDLEPRPIQENSSSIQFSHNIFGGTFQPQQGMILPTGGLEESTKHDVTDVNFKPKSSIQEESVMQVHTKDINPSGSTGNGTVAIDQNLNRNVTVKPLSSDLNGAGLSSDVGKQQGSGGNPTIAPVDQPLFMHALFGGTFKQSSALPTKAQNIERTEKSSEIPTKAPEKPMDTPPSQGEKGQGSLNNRIGVKLNQPSTHQLSSANNIQNESKRSLVTSGLKDKKPKILGNNDDGGVGVILGSTQQPSKEFDKAGANKEGSHDDVVVVPASSLQSANPSVKNKEHKHGGGEEDVVVLSVVNQKSPDLRDNEEKHRAQRRKRRRQMKQMRLPGVVPSFIQLITPKTEEEEEKNEPLVIDVDEYLGLNNNVPIPAGVPSNIIKQETIQRPPKTPLPKDEGWYEGSIGVGLSDESRYLNAIHVLTRKNLEFFSASQADTETIQAGRKQPVVLGQVGIRCIHCAKAAADVTNSAPMPDGIGSIGNKYSTGGSVAKLWPAGSVSYPINIAGLYPVCSQKPAMHFENCPNTPLDVKGQFYRLIHDDGGPSKRRKPDGESKSISVLLYYAIACARVGLVDTKSGMRFSRDLKLDPLSIESVRSQVEEGTVKPGKRVSPVPQASKQMAQANARRLVADEESEKVLNAAASESYDPNVDLARSDDRNYVSDFIFLCIKQMAVCHAFPADFNTRGKKTKLMRIGFAGFCCKHCSRFETIGYTGQGDYSCRSFASAADNLASAIANSFHIHLQKCSMLPPEIKKALAAYKRLHSRQLSSLPHGSQRKLFHIMWKRLRACDKSEAEVEEITSKLERSANEIKTAQVSANIPVGQNVAVPVGALSTGTNFESSAVSLPECDDEETRAVLKAAEEDKDPASNDNLLLPSDRPLITDFIFLIMKQAKVAQPSALDFVRGRRSTQLNSKQAGLCCKHCINQAGYGVSMGRSFPSQADNLASSLNTSLYQHIQRCQFAPDNLKRAVVNLKKMHSVQVSALRFGSQRRFFNLLWDRLSAVEVVEASLNEADASNPAVPMPRMHCPGKSAKPNADDSTILKLGFIPRSVGSSECFECQYCRMVPMSLRADGSVLLNRPTEEHMQRHRSDCKGDSLDLNYAARLFKELVKSCEALSLEIISTSTSEVSASFKDIVRELVGGDEKLLFVFTDGIANAAAGNDAAQGEKQDGGFVSLLEKLDTKGLWCKFPSLIDVDKLSSLFGKFAKNAGLSPELREHSHFIRYFQTVSPSFVYPSKSFNAEETLSSQSS